MYEKLTKCPNLTRYLPENIFADFWGEGSKCPLLLRLLRLWDLDGSYTGGREFIDVLVTCV